MIKIDVKKYIEENGIVSDKETAINLLCETSDAWKVIDESLKSDPEVLMYYQPFGYVGWNFYNYYCRDIEIGIYSETELGMSYDQTLSTYHIGSETTPEEGFIVEKIGNREYFLPAGIELGPYKETYLAIQQELMEDYHYSREDCPLFRYVSPRFDCDNYEDTTIIFNRNRLREIVRKHLESTGEATNKQKIHKLR